PAECRVMPRASAMASATPIAAEAKLWDVSCVVCEKYDIVVSPLYDCQLVFVVKEAAVSNACRSGTAPIACGFSGRRCCKRSTAYVSSMDAALKISMAAAYRVQCWS